MFWRKRKPEDFNAEVEAHIALEVERLKEQGMNEGDARAAARRSFGNVTRAQEKFYESSRWIWFEQLSQDIRYGLRQLRRSPGFTAVAVLTLALGIGANAAIFSVLDGVLLKPLPYPRADQLVSVELSPLAVDPNIRGIAPEDYFIFREQSRTFQDVGIYLETDTDRDVNVTGFAEPERVHALHATEGVLSVLAARPLLGRVFSPADDVPSAPPTAILTYSYWQRKYGGNPDVVGKTIDVDGKARQIIGVLPRNFQFLDMQDLSLILPLQLDRNKTRLGNFAYFGIARLKEGRNATEAGADMARMLPITFSAFPPSPGLSVDFLRKARLAPSVLPLKQEVVGNIGTMLWVLMAGVGLVLFIACANVANLLLVRAEGRRHEFVLRAALGASRRRLAAQLLRESAVIGLLGGVSGLGLAWAALRLIVRLAPAGLPRINEIALDWPELFFTLGMAVLTSLLFGLIPVLRHTRIRAGLGESSRTGPGREHHRARNVLVTVQVALALVLLICSGLMLRTFRALQRVDPGFARPAELQTFRISIPPSDVPEDEDVVRIEQQIQNRLASIPGVASAGFSSAVPMDGNNAALDNVFAADRADEPGSVPPFRRIVFISPGYLRTMGIPLLAGRDLTWAEAYNHAPVALISENFAREYWGTPTAALGKRIRPSASNDWREIVGVVGDVHDESVSKPARTIVYWPTLMANYRSGRTHVDRYATFAVRSPLAGSEDFMKQVRAAVWSVDAKRPLARVHTLNYYYTQSMSRASFTLVMLGLAGSMALLLGTVGLYGVMAYSVSQRTREIGVRIALGASQGAVVKQVVRQGMQLTLAGIALGLAAAFMATRALASLLYGISATDPATFVAVSIALVIVALIASSIPARRATKVDPMVALRYE